MGIHMSERNGINQIEANAAVPAGDAKTTSTGDATASEPKVEAAGTTAPKVEPAKIESASIAPKVEPLRPNQPKPEIKSATAGRPTPVPANPSLTVFADAADDDAGSARA